MSAEPAERMTRPSDVVVFGRSGTLGEFAIAFDARTPGRTSSTIRIPTG